MKAYKWMYEDANTICRVPGFAFDDYNLAMQNRDDFTSWVGSKSLKEANIYEFDVVDPIKFPICFSSILMNRPPCIVQLDVDKINKVFEKFRELPDDYFTTAKISDPFIADFHNLAHSVGCLKSDHPDRSEIYVGWTYVMKRVQI